MKDLPRSGGAKILEEFHCNSHVTHIQATIVETDAKVMVEFRCHVVVTHIQPTTLLY